MTAELELRCADLDAAVALFGSLGFRIEMIVPADEPEVIRIARGDVRVRLVRDATAPVVPDDALVVPPLVPAAVVTRAHADGWHLGRAGMQYRDLIPDRLGGWLIASHIRIPGGGPVPDYVHLHAIRFQLIYCRRGWVRVVYEDRGEPFVMEAGDCVVQPPRIRHRVLESSSGLEVIELACPARHATFVDHDLVLPTAQCDRTYDGQRFSWHRAVDAHAGTIERDLGVAAATGGLVIARVLRGASGSRVDGRVRFGFVLAGRATLTIDGVDHALATDDAFVVPGHHELSVAAGGELLDVSCA